MLCSIANAILLIAIICTKEVLMWEILFVKLMLRGGRKVLLGSNTIPSFRKRVGTRKLLLQHGGILLTPGLPHFTDLFDNRISLLTAWFLSIHFSAQIQKQVLLTDGMKLKAHQNIPFLFLPRFGESKSHNVQSPEMWNSNVLIWHNRVWAHTCVCAWATHTHTHTRFCGTDLEWAAANKPADFHINI